jgi:hypothetical protein
MSVQKNLCQFVLYLVGNCVSLCHFGEVFLLVEVEEVYMPTSLERLSISGRLRRRKKVGKN